MFLTVPWRIFFCHYHRLKVDQILPVQNRMFMSFLALILKLIIISLKIMILTKKWIILATLKKESKILKMSFKFHIKKMIKITFLVLFAMLPDNLWRRKKQRVMNLKWKMIYLIFYIKILCFSTRPENSHIWKAAFGSQQIIDFAISIFEKLWVGKQIWVFDS